ncbi:M-phase inducer phosphatase-like isoform X1 [Amphibalanus amphitrite]|uniref:M-phase inducer phosphatase-like isoform X1 n=1 Tax=Amphibalanus amphitrite TaxID=1232801 RepID=UPI001C92563F|nr:M-phase inducer phosphatase-like isoform X1 [Amphibalanus amphitrite]
MSGPQRRRLELPMPNRSGLVVRSDPALPSPVTDLANNLSAASISQSPGRRGFSSSSDEADTPTTSAVLGGRSRSRRLLRDVSLDEWSGTPESAGRPAPLRRNRSLPVRQRLLSAADSPALDKENAPLLSPAAKLDGSFDFSSPKRASYSDRSARAPDGGCSRRLPLGQLQRAAPHKAELAETADPCSQDSGYDASERDDFRFAAPTARPPRRVRSSASSGSSGSSPARLQRSDSDGFMDAIALDTMDESAMPAGLQELLSAPILHSPASEPAAAAAGQPAHRRPPIRRFLSMVEHPTTDAARAHATLTDRMPVPVPGRVGQFKRPEPPAHEPCSPTRKRLCSLAEASPSPSPSPPRAFELQRSESHRLTPVSERVRPLQRCFSESEATIKRAVQRSCQDPDLIGDSTRPYVLPLVHTSRNNDLKAISGETLARLMDGHFNHVVESFEIVDCRYPYEFDGGHIRGAVNLYTRDGIHERLLANRRALPPPSEADQIADKKRHIVVFHCEFSSERGPSMYRFLREQDRKLNKATYPALLYPEIYLLEGGYKKFFERHLEQCEPRTYKPMNKEGHESDLKHFRAKSKSWAGDSRARGVSKRIFS